MMWSIVQLIEPLEADGILVTRGRAIMGRFTVLEHYCVIYGGVPAAVSANQPYGGDGSTAPVRADHPQIALVHQAAVRVR